MPRPDDIARRQPHGRGAALAFKAVFDARPQEAFERRDLRALGLIPDTQLRHINDTLVRHLPDYVLHVSGRQNIYGHPSALAEMARLLEIETKGGDDDADA